MAAVRTFMWNDVEKMFDTERMITNALVEVTGGIRAIAFVYERKKIWKVVAITNDNRRIEIPINQFSMFNEKKFKDELRKYYISLNLMNSSITVYHYPSQVNYYVVTNQIQAKDLAMGWIRKAFRNGLDIAVEQGKYSIVIDKKIEALCDYLVGKKKEDYIYSFDRISVSVGFWSYDLLVGAIGNILIVKNRKEKEELINLLKEKIKRGI